ncbi:MAG: aldo/keto reductase [Oscillospiraceae bacterium]|nr:aldo/keto reductase [Oscillospiraceae bacterium]
MKQLPKIALGAWAWGNDGTFGGSLSAETLKPIFDAAMERGLKLWNTAYAYGMGASEQVLNEKGKIDYQVFKPVLFEFPTYEYFVTGDKVGNCGRMN